MALGDYTPTAWVDDTTPAIDATTLGHIETKVDEIDAASAATTGTIIWSTSNDGNGGQPPAPKPIATTNTIGRWYYEISPFCANSQSGGTYAIIAFNSSGQMVGALAGVAQGANISATFGTCDRHTYWRTA